MDKRAFKRIPAAIDVRFLCNSSEYKGTITNISENGMYISTREICSPFASQFEVIIDLKGKDLAVPVNMSRILLSPDSHDGIGVQLINDIPEFTALVESLKKGQVLETD